MTIMGGKIGRNDPCDCGSGRKYKKCCLRYAQDHSFLGKKVWSIREAVVGYTLDQVLMGFRNYEGRPLSDALFLRIIACEFAIRFCQPTTSGETRAITVEELDEIAQSLSEYAFTDQFGYDPEVSQEFIGNPESVVPVRFFAKQFEPHIYPFPAFAEGLMLFHQIPDYLKNSSQRRYNFDVQKEVVGVLGTDYLTFCRTCFASWWIAREHPGMKKSNVTDFAEKTYGVSRDIAKVILDSFLSATPVRFMQSLDDFMSSDPRNAMCAVSPLYANPFIQPWSERFDLELQDRIISPLPHLIAYKASIGVYYMLLSKFGIEFTNVFGYIFEEYVGRLLQSAFSSENVIPERELDVIGKKPDYLIIEGDTAILVECKSFRYTQELLTDSTIESLKRTTSKLGKALVKLEEFIAANKSSVFRGLSFSRFVPVVVTWGKMHLMKAPAYEPVIKRMLLENDIHLPEWFLMDIHELELIEPYIPESGLAQILTQIESNPFSVVYESLSKNSELSFKDSMLYAVMRTYLLQQLKDNADMKISIDA